VGIHSLRMTAGRGCGQTGKAAHRRSITEDWSEESHLVGKGLLRLSVERVIPVVSNILCKRRFRFWQWSLFRSRSRGCANVGAVFASTFA
jgi:hypothetical protein